MMKNQSARANKGNHAVRFLLRNRNASVREAMLVAEFQKKQINDLSMRKAISRSFVKALRALVPPTTIVQHEGTSLDLSPLTADTVVASTTTAACSSTTDDAITVPLPKRKKQRTTASALEKKRVDDLKMKKHKAAAHKEAVRLYLQERAIPEGGMSLRQVQDQIKKKYSVTVHYSSICRYANKGLIASPKQMGPPGTIAKANYKLLCAALSSFIPMNQMNSRSGDNTRPKLIFTLAKTVGMSSPDAGKLLDRLL